ncbi:formylglycine-generating enzyme family protein [Frigidibacter sp. MR17.14]|uniref:formylglycine-generating enzyme family protein n=1 Tax=Frigidibacter sp. MR17.14 TaxID=3126509 RepID=UPI003012E642
MAGCCPAPAAGGTPPGTGATDPLLARALALPPAPAALRTALAAELVAVPGGIFAMGARRARFPEDLDAPRHKVRVSGFRIAPVAVTNAAFARFVAATGYRTLAETEGWSFVFHLLLGPTAGDHPRHPPGLPWWRQVDGACWHSPEGPGSSTAGREDHPVVHVSWYDARAYAAWAGLRLPTEAEWERAARGGLSEKRFPWGDAFAPGGRAAMNTFQGDFPQHDSAEDGWAGTAPVTAYAPNGYGLHNMTGNVWEWVEDRFGALPAPARLPPADPRGPATGEFRVQRGGSFLCHDSYCDRYHVHSRGKAPPDSTASNTGFRVASNA